MPGPATHAPAATATSSKTGPASASSAGSGLSDSLADPLATSTLGGPPGGGAPPPPPAAGGRPGGLTASSTLATPEFGKFAAAMADIGVDAVGAQAAWTTVVDQLIQAEAAMDAVSTDMGGWKRADLASEGFKKLMSEYQLPKQLDDAFERMIAQDMAGKTVALWSGAAAKTAAGKSGKAQVFLEGTPLGKPFDESGLPKGVPSGTLHWASVSRAYAQKLADHAEEVNFAGFVDSNTVESGNIAAEVEIPIVGKAVEKAGKKITWHAAAAEKDAKVWAQGKQIQTSGGAVLTSEPGFWTSGEDRGAVIKKAKESHKAFTDDAAATAVPAPSAAPSTSAPATS